MFGVTRHVRRTQCVCVFLFVRNARADIVFVAGEKGEELQLWAYNICVWMYAFLHESLYQTRVRELR